MRQNAILYINGERVEVDSRYSGMMLADYLRQVRNEPGTKIVCSEGDCGACSVLVAFAGFQSLRPFFVPVNSCILTVAQLDGCSVVTVDALASDGQLTPAQTSMMKCHGSQCGFCTPGFVVALTGLIEKRLARKNLESISEREAKNALTGNLCRCTGYQPIIDAAVSLPLADCSSVGERFLSAKVMQDLRASIRKPLHIESDGFEFFAPTTRKQAAVLLSKNKQVRILSGATDAGVVHNKWKNRLHSVMSLHLIPELYKVRSLKNGRISVGARVTLERLRGFCKDRAPEFARFLDLFASPQIKNVATLAGNVANASPIADTPPFLLVCDGVIHVQGARGPREIPIEKFFIAYRKTALKSGEFITAIEFSPPSKNDSLFLRKVSERKDLDISCVNAAVLMTWDNREERRIREARIALGGVAATTLRLPKTEAALRGNELSQPVIDKAVQSLQTEIKPISDVRGSSAFRRVLAENVVRRILQEPAP